MRCAFVLPAAISCSLALAMPAGAATRAPVHLEMRPAVPAFSRESVRFAPPPLRFNFATPPETAAPHFTAPNVERPATLKVDRLAPATKHLDLPTPEPSPFNNPLHRLLMADLAREIARDAFH